MTNSQVPFILVTTYKTYDQLATLASQYPNSIIFYKAENVNTGLEEASIWAHGEEYKTGGGNVRVRIGSVDVDPTDATVGFGSQPALGDFYIKETAIANTTGKYTRTAYVYALNSSNELVWQVLDGNVNAENVYFPTGFERTEKWGTQQTEKTDPGVDSGITGMNLKEIFEFYLVKEKWPSVSTETLNTTVPTFTASDGGTTLNVYTGSAAVNENKIKNDAEILYNTALYAESTYNPELTATNTPSASLVFGPNKIKGMYASKGWCDSVDGTNITISGVRTGNSVTVETTLSPSNGFNSNGTSTTTMKLDDNNFTPSKTTSGTGTNSLTLTKELGAQTSLGSHTISIENENGITRSASYKINGEGNDITELSIPAIGDTYYLSNKGNRQSDKKINKASYSVTGLPTTVTKTISDASLTYKVYLPLYVGRSNASASTLLSAKYFNSDVVVFDNENLGITVGLLDYSYWKVAMPSTCSIVSFKVNNQTMTSADDYSLVEESAPRSINGANVQYKVLQFKKNEGFPADAKVYLKIR